MKKGKDGFYNRVVKPCLDWLFALFFVLCFFWVYLLISLAIKVDDSKGPVIFKQERIGKKGKVYWMYKFRTMRVGTEHTGSGVYSDDTDTRVTRVGKILRKTSLDELPQMFNILAGQMSLIGYRSPLTYHPWTWEEYSEEQKNMFDMKPGITGWAQVNGRRTVEWDKRIEMNLWYAENVSLGLDCKIVFMTIMKVFRNSDNENVGVTVHK